MPLRPVPHACGMAVRRHAAASTRAGLPLQAGWPLHVSQLPPGRIPPWVSCVFFIPGFSCVPRAGGPGASSAIGHGIRQVGKGGNAHGDVGMDTHRRRDAMSNELYLATTIDGIEIEVEVYEGQRTVVVPGRGSFTLPSRSRALLFVNDGLDVDPILPIVRHLLGFEPDTKFYWEIRAHGRRAQTAHRLGHVITVRRAQAWRRNGHTPSEKEK